MKIVSLQSVGLGAIFSDGNNEPYTITVGEDLYDRRGYSLDATVTEINYQQAELNAKQAEVNGKDQVISELTKKLSDQKNANDADMAQAVKDAQDTRAKSDQIVNQYVGK